MSAPVKPWNINEAQVLKSSQPNPVIPQMGISRHIPALPPRPTGTTTTPINSYGGVQSPYSNYGYGSTYGSLGYRSPMYGSYGYGGGSYGYGNYGMYGMDFSPRDDTERRFIQFAEESSRNTFANVESVVRAVNSISMMLDNTFFAMTSSFRAIISVAENFGRLRNMFGHIWYSMNIFRLFRWLYRRLMALMGYKIPDSAVSVAWKEAYHGAAVEASAAGAPGGGSNWSTLAFFGVLISAPYLISKFLLPKYEDKYNPEKWKMPGIRAKAAFDFVATSNNELSLRINDEILLAPKYIQEEMKLYNTGWAFAVGNGKAGQVPLNYVVIQKRVNNGGVLKNTYNNNNNNNNSSSSQNRWPEQEQVPVPSNRIFPKNNVKRVSFGENQIIESNGTERIVKIPDVPDQQSLMDTNKSNVVTNVDANPHVKGDTEEVKLETVVSSAEPITTSPDATTENADVKGK